jgi:hypothetical protein
METPKLPSEPLLLWTCYGLLVMTGIVALAFIVAGGVPGKTEGSVLLWKVVSSLKTLRRG